MGRSKDPALENNININSVNNVKDDSKLGKANGDAKGPGAVKEETIKSSYYEYYGPDKKTPEAAI